MFLALAVLIIALVLGGVGFAIHALWIAAVIALLIWVLGFLVKGAERSWYRW